MFLESVDFVFRVSRLALLAFKFSQIQLPDVSLSAAFLCVIEGTLEFCSKASLNTKYITALNEVEPMLNKLFVLFAGSPDPAHAEVGL
jgi:hypothetical protein